MARIAFVFPGQGSQSTAMLVDLAADWPQVRSTFDEASAILGHDLWALVRDNPDGALDRTVNTQPAMLAAGVAVHRVWQAAGGSPGIRMAGHSLGEYSALVAAGALRFEHAVALVAERARLMQNAVPDGMGAMAAILGLDDSTVIRVCAEAAGHGTVEAVNFNAPGQVVIAGEAEAVSAAVEAARAAGARRAVALPVSVPSHSSLMKEAAEQLSAQLAQTEIVPPAVPVVHNVDAAPRHDPDGIRQALVRQLYNPVRWAESVRAMTDAGLDALVELGPGRVLTGLARRIDRTMTAVAVDDPDTLARALELGGEQQA